jgi:hypothetical protein
MVVSILEILWRVGRRVAQIAKSGSEFECRGENNHEHFCLISTLQVVKAQSSSPSSGGLDLDQQIHWPRWHGSAIAGDLFDGRIAKRYRFFPAGSGSWGGAYAGVRGTVSNRDPIAKLIA